MNKGILSCHSNNKTLGNGKIFSFTNQPAHEHLGPIPSKVLHILFGTINVLILWLNYPEILFHILSGNENV